MKTNHAFVLLILVGLISCGNDSKNGGSGGQNLIVEREMVKLTNGSYYTILRPVNFYSNGFIPYGAATFTVDGDQVQVNTSMDDDQAVMHRQSLHLGTRCPTLSDDTNGDGLVDYREALAVVGEAIIPLDNDLNTQTGGAEVYPRGPGMTYSRTASLEKIQADLSKPDEDTTDNITKLSPGKRLSFEGKVVLIHGTAPQSAFPLSLAAYKSEPAHISLPVVCGVLKKIE